MLKKRILILNDGSKYENWGIKACIDGLKKILNSNELGFELIGLEHEFMHKKYLFDPKLLGRRIFLEDNRIVKKFFKPFHELPKVADEFEYIADLWMSGSGGRGADKFLELAQTADLIVFNAEGSTYRNNIGAIKGLFMLWLAKTRLNKKTAFMNGSVTLTLVDSVLPAMIQKVFSVIDLVHVREEFSKRSIVEFYPDLENRVNVFPDSAFVLDLLSKEDPRAVFLPDKYFVFSLSMLPMDYSRSKDKSALVEIILELKKLVPNAVLIAKDTEDQILKEVAQLTNSVFIGSNFTYRAIARVLEKADFIFSGRYHHSIFGAMVGCPVIPMASSSHKIHGLAELFDGIMLSPPIDPTNLRIEKKRIIEAAKKYIKGGEKLRNKFKQRSTALRDDAMSQVKAVANLLS